ncbi:MAG: hypothetical protein RIQ81_1719 [Pseudomonadota bacterium]|jgi:hypothetical protein
MAIHPATKSFGLREHLSRVLAPDRSSRWLGHRFEESLVKQAVGQVLAGGNGTMPGRVVVMASSPELEAITRSGLCGMLASAFMGSLELRELAYPVMREFLEQTSDNAPVMVIAIGTEKRPLGWPLPDFGKWLPAGFLSKPDQDVPGYLRFDSSGHWLRMDRKGNATVLEARPLPNAAEDKVNPQGNRKNDSGKSVAGAFDFSWGIWAGQVMPAKTPVAAHAEEKRIVCQAMSLGSGSAARVVLPAATRERLSEFLAGEGAVYISSPTLECSEWLLAEGGHQSGQDQRFHFVEQSHGWGPAFSLLRFYCDARPGDRMIVLRDLTAIDLIAAAPLRQGNVS